MEGLLEGGDEKRVDACGRKGGVAGKLVADVSANNAKMGLKSWRQAAASAPDQAATK
jgi:hypothetical protein